MVIPQYCIAYRSLLHIILRVIIAHALENGRFSLRRDLAEEVNHHFLENDLTRSDSGHIIFSVVLN